MFKKITFDVETITPMFLSGADQGKAELRAASIKGLLRFWWRALQAETDLEKLRNRESQIFGAPDEKIGGSSFAIRITYDKALFEQKIKKGNLPNYPVEVMSQGQVRRLNILEYLSYGAFKNREGGFREYVQEKFPFSLHIQFTDEKHINDILATIYVFNLFGCVGARSRNGFGSFHIYNRDEAFVDIKDILSTSNPYEVQNLKKLIRNNGITSYPAFSKGVQIFKAKGSFNSAFDSLADVGKTYRNTKGGLEERHNFESRQFIGAPLDPPRKRFKSILPRHAKPYFVKVAKEGSKYRSYILYLPSLYCDGLKQDDMRQPANNAELNRQFSKVCNEFNTFLSQNMETIL